MTRTKLNRISVNKLDFSNKQHLYGREHEMQILTKLLNDITVFQDNDTTTENSASSPSCDRGLVMIEGISGAGKSALAKYLESAVRTKRGFLALGKFDLLTQQDIRDPLSAIQGCMVHLIDQILSLKEFNSSRVMETTSSICQSCKTEDSKQHLYDTIQAELSKLKAEMHILIRFIPNLQSLIGSEETLVSTYLGDSDDPNYKESSDQLNYALRKLIQAITQIVPVVLVCDDLQWCDMESLALLKSWIHMDTKSLIVIGCFRANVKPEIRVLLRKLVDDTKALQAARSIQVVEFVLENVNATGIEAWLTDLLILEEEKARALAGIVLMKTGGSPLAIQQYLLSPHKRSPISLTNPPACCMLWKYLFRENFAYHSSSVS